MAVRPKRKSPISTRPIYLPKVPAKELRAAAGVGVETAGAGPRVYADSWAVGFDADGLAQRLAAGNAPAAVVAGELVSALAGRPHGEVRDAVAAAANRLAWARIGDPEQESYRSLPLRGEVDQEEARFRARTQPEYEGLQTPAYSMDVLYDGAEVQAAFRDLLPAGDAGATSAVVVTDRRIASWDAGARRWTPLAVLPGDPVLVSVTAPDAPPDADALAEEVGRAIRR